MARPIIKTKEQSHQNDVDRMKALRPDVPEESFDIEASEEIAMAWDEFQGWC